VPSWPRALFQGGDTFALLSCLSTTTSRSRDCVQTLHGTEDGARSPRQTTAATKNGRTRECVMATTLCVQYVSSHSLAGTLHSPLLTLARVLLRAENGGTGWVDGCCSGRSHSARRGCMGLLARVRVSPQCAGSGATARSCRWRPISQQRAEAAWGSRACVTPPVVLALRCQDRHGGAPATARPTRHVASLGACRAAHVAV
jgi:hypothetical protein